MYYKIGLQSRDGLHAGPQEMQLLFLLNKNWRRPTYTVILKM